MELLEGVFDSSSLEDEFEVSKKLVDISEIKEVTRDELMKRGVELSTVEVCRKIRRLAKLDQIKFDEVKLQNEMDKNLVNHIKNNESTVSHFMRIYLSTLQPYMLVAVENQDYVYMCLIDRIYPVYITTFGNEIIISVCKQKKMIEYLLDKVYGVNRKNRSRIKVDNSRRVPVFADRIASAAPTFNDVGIDIIALRGMKILSVNVIGKKCEDFFIVRQHDIEQQLVSFCEEYIEDLYASKYNIDFDKIGYFSRLQQIAFTVDGNDVFTSVSLLIDVLNSQTDFISRRTTDFVLITFIQSLLLTNEQKEDLMELLEEKYKMGGRKETQIVLNRVIDIIEEGDIRRWH